MFSLSLKVNFSGMKPVMTYQPYQHQNVDLRDRRSLIKKGFFNRISKEYL